MPLARGVSNTREQTMVGGPQHTWGGRVCETRLVMAVTYIRPKETQDCGLPPGARHRREHVARGPAPLRPGLKLTRMRIC